MRAFLAASFCLLGGAVLAAEPELKGKTFPGEKIEIIWSPTNRLPAAFWIYKVEPQDFSAAVISNLMALGKFTEKDRVAEIEGQLGFQDKRGMCFENKESTRHLGIYPSSGFIYYKDDKACVDAKTLESVKGVPRQEELLPLGLSWIDKLGIPRSELARKEGGSEFDVSCEEGEHGRFYQRTNLHRYIILRGISFFRSIDGANFTSGGGGFRISFGNDGKVDALELVWRNLKRYKSCKIVSPAQTIDLIKRGKTKVHPFSRVDLIHAKKLIITKVEPFYLGQSGDKLQEFMYPFLSLVCTVELQDGTTTQTALQCPILAE